MTRSTPGLLESNMRSLALIAMCMATSSPVLGFLAPLNPMGTTVRAAQPTSSVTMLAEGARGGSRRDLLKSAGLMLPLAALLPLAKSAPALAADMVTTASGLKYSVLENGNGETPKIGELVAIRFRGAYNNVVFDDVYGTREPYYFRVGGGNLLPGIEEAVQMMKVGDRWKLTIPGDLAFGKKGRSASPGKPRIPPMATVEYELTLVGLPGREPEIIDLQDFDENAPASDDSVNFKF